MPYTALAFSLLLCVVEHLVETSAIISTSFSSLLLCSQNAVCVSAFITASLVAEYWCLVGLGCFLIWFCACEMRIMQSTSFSTCSLFSCAVVCGTCDPLVAGVRLLHIVTSRSVARL